MQRAIVALLPELRGRAARYCRDRSTAEDLVQDTIERALRFSHQFEPGSNARAWMFQILFSVVMTQHRTRKRRACALQKFSVDPVSWPSAGRDSSPDASLPLTGGVRDALRALPDSYQEVVTLVDLEGWSYREAAESLNVPLGTVMSRLSRARRVLGSRLNVAA